MKIEELEKELKQNKLRSIYLLYGEETFLLESALKSIIKNFGEKVKGINYVLLDENNVGEIISDIETPAFGYERKLIIVKNAEFFKKDLKKKSKNDITILKEKLNEYIKENIDTINDAVVLVFIEENAEKCELLETIDKLGVVCNFQTQKPFQLQQRLKSIVDAYKVNIDMSTLTYFIECCGTDMQELINEIRKLIEYAGTGGTITKQDIDL